MSPSTDPFDGGGGPDDAAQQQPQQEQCDAGDQEPHHGASYRSRKPKWWTQLSGRRGTRAQRKAIRRMTERGYCLSKEVLTEFSRASNASRRSSASDVNDAGDGPVESSTRNEWHSDEWKRAWWDRYLGIANDQTAGSPSFILDDPAEDTIGSGKSEKYAHQVQQMYNQRNPLPPRKYRQVWLEIGFGNGDNLLANARNHPDILFVGCEIHQPGIGTLLRRMEAEMGLLGGGDLSVNCEGEATPASDSSATHQSTIVQEQQSSETSCQNVRILPGDGIKLLSHLPDDYVDAILITFPDPWPRDCHVCWRVIQREVVHEMRRVLTKRGASCGGNGRVYVATDAECFDEWTREVFKRESSSSLFEEMVPCPVREDWLPVVSYYEQKGLDEGRRTMLQCWRLCG